MTARPSAWWSWTDSHGSLVTSYRPYPDAFGEKEITMMALWGHEWAAVAWLARLSGDLARAQIHASFGCEEPCGDCAGCLAADEHYGEAVG